MSTMTLEQVRDAMKLLVSSKNHFTQIVMRQWIEAIDAHLRREVKVPDVTDEDAYWACKHHRITRDEPSQAEMMRAKRHLEWFASKLAAAPTSVATDGQGGEWK